MSRDPDLFSDFVDHLVSLGLAYKPGGLPDDGQFLRIDDDDQLVFLSMEPEHLHRVRKIMHVMSSLTARWDDFLALRSTCCFRLITFHIGRYVRQGGVSDDGSGFITFPDAVQEILRDNDLFCYPAGWKGFVWRQIDKGRLPRYFLRFVMPPYVA